VEEQILGQIPGDCASGDGQCQPAQVSTVNANSQVSP
jgi:hypothetical protein